MPDSDSHTHVHAPGARGAQVGDNNTQHNTFVLTAGALAVVAVAGVALTFTYQAWEGQKKPPRGRRPPPPSPRTRGPPGPRTTKPRREAASPTPTPSEESPTPTDEPTTDEPSTPSFDPTTLDDAPSPTAQPITVDAPASGHLHRRQGCPLHQEQRGSSDLRPAVQEQRGHGHPRRSGLRRRRGRDRDYVDTDANVLVAVEVMALADKATAVIADSRLKDNNTGGWRYRCPKIGTGANV